MILRCGRAPLTDTANEKKSIFCCAFFSKERDFNVMNYDIFLWDFNTLNKYRRELFPNLRWVAA